MTESRPLRILTLVVDLGKGGVQRTAQNFAEAFHDLGHESRVLSMLGGVRQEMLEDHSIEVTVGLSADGLARLAAWRPDAVHLHAHLLEPSTVDHILSSLPETPVIELNVFSVPSPWTANVDFSHQLSTWCLWLYRQRQRRRPGAPSLIIPNPIETTAFSPATTERVDELRRRLDLPPDALVLGRIGQSFLAKWSLNIIDIFEQLAGDGRLHLLLVNPPQEVVGAAHGSNVADRIRIIGRIDGDRELSAAYTLMDVFVHIAEGGESFGIVLLEAQMCQTPIVTWSTPWADNSQIEVVRNGVGGFVATHRRGFLQATSLLVRSPELRRDMGKAGRAHAEGFDRMMVADQVVTLVREGQSQARVPGQIERQVDQLYSASFDPPTRLERRILLSGPPKLRLLLKYLSGFKPWRHLLTRPIALPLRKVRGALQRSG